MTRNNKVPTGPVTLCHPAERASVRGSGSQTQFLVQDTLSSECGHVRLILAGEARQHGILAIRRQTDADALLASIFCLPIRTASCVYET